jgi:hypothetical protein
MKKIRTWKVSVPPEIRECGNFVGVSQEERKVEISDNNSRENNINASIKKVLFVGSGLDRSYFE